MCTVYGVLFSFLWLKPVQDWPTMISVSAYQQLRLGQKVWFGRLSAISQLASRVGEGGGVGQLCLQSVTQPYTSWPRWREQGGGLRSLPLHIPWRFSSKNSREEFTKQFNDHDQIPLLLPVGELSRERVAYL